LSPGCRTLGRKCYGCGRCVGLQTLGQRFPTTCKRHAPTPGKSRMPRRTAALWPGQLSNCGSVRHSGQIDSLKLGGRSVGCAGSSVTENEWLTYLEVIHEFGVKKSHLYGSLSRMVRTRQIPGESKKWSRSDLKRLAERHTTSPATTASSSGIAGPPTRRRTRRAARVSVKFKYL